MLRRLTAKAPGPLPRLEQLLSGGLLQRYRHHRAQAEGQNLLTSSQCIVVDINQNVGYRRALRDMVPTLMKSTVLVVLFADAAQDCLLTPGELASIHGLDISPSVLRRLRVGQVRALVGNSMHVAQIGAFVQFALATRTWSSDQ